MITILEPSVQFLASLQPHFREFASMQHSLSVSLLQVTTFLHMFSALLNDYITHDQKKLKSLAGCSASRSDVASSKSHQSVGSCSASDGEQVADGLSLAAENLSNAADDRSALKHLIALAYIWGFGSSLLERCQILDTS